MKFHKGRNVTKAQMHENMMLSCLRGLSEGKPYTTFDSLHYGERKALQDLCKKGLAVELNDNHVATSYHAKSYEITPFGADTWERTEKL